MCVWSFLLLERIWSFRPILRGLVTWIFLATDLLLRRAVHSVGQRGLSGFSSVFQRSQTRNFQDIISLTITPLGDVTHPITFSETKLNMSKQSIYKSKHIKWRFKGAYYLKYITLLAPKGKKGKWALFEPGVHWDQSAKDRADSKYEKSSFAFLINELEPPEFNCMSWAYTVCVWLPINWDCSCHGKYMCRPFFSFLRLDPSIKCLIMPRFWRFEL